MRIGSSTDLSIQRQIQLNDTNRTRSLERLSSGLRINRAADDAAGLAISESLRAEIRGTAMAMRNVQDGIGMVQTAEASFEQIHLMLQRMRELSVQGANGTYTTQQRLAMQMEIEELKRGIDGIAYQAMFNGKHLLTDADKAPRVTDMAFSYLGSAVAPDPAPVGFPANPTSAAFLTAGGATVSGVTAQNVIDAETQLSFLVAGALRKAEGMLIDSGLDHSLIVPTPNFYFVIDPTAPTRYAVSDTNYVAINLYSIYGAPPGNPAMTLEQAMTRGVADMLMKREDNNATGAGGDMADWFTLTGNYDNMRTLFTETAAESYLAYTPPGAFSFDAVDADGGRSASAWFGRFLIENYGQSAVAEIAEIVVNADAGNKGAMTPAIDSYLLALTGEASRAALAATVNTWIAAQPTVQAGVTSSLANTTSSAAQLLGDDPLDPSFTLQVGAYQGQTFELAMYAGALGNLDFAGLVAVTDPTVAGRSISTLDQSIAIVSNARASLGAQVNALEYTYNTLAATNEKLTAAESRIRDTDLAAESITQTRAELFAVTSGDMLKRFHTLQRERVATLLAQ